MAKKPKTKLTAFEHVVRTHETQLRRFEAELSDTIDRHQVEVTKLREKIGARKDILARLRSVKS